MTSEEAIKILQTAEFPEFYTVEEVQQALNVTSCALQLFDKLDEIITEQIDISNNQVECQTLRWVLDKMSEMLEEEE